MSSITLTPEAVRAEVLRLAEDIFECTPSELVDGAHISEELGANSLTRLEFLVALEHRFGRRFNHDELHEAQRLGEVVAVVQRQVGG